MTTIAVGCDHAGYNLKKHLADHLEGLGYEVLDLGAHSTDRVDYPEYGAAVGRAVLMGKQSMAYVSVDLVLEFLWQQTRFLE